LLHVFTCNFHISVVHPNTVIGYIRLVAVVDVLGVIFMLGLLTITTHAF
jgi:hypothetical protein